MTINQKYIALALATALVVTGASLGVLSLAQTVTTLGCSVSMPSVAENQSVTVSAMGGDGTYSWSGPNLNIANNTGSQFTVSYPDPGTYPINVASGGQNATCDVTVLATTSPVSPSSNTLNCYPATQNVTLGQTASVSATGGDGTYTWSATNLNITNPSGSGFTADYGSIGPETLTVTSDGLTATCNVEVVAAPVITTPPTTPGLPDTGGM